MVTTIQEQSLFAGAAQVDITPPLGTLINGDFFPHTATYIHDALFAKALYLQHNNVCLVMVVVDTCVMSVDYTRQIRTQIADNTGIPFAHISISTTHTHAAGSVSEVHLCQPDPVYSKLLPERIVEVVKQAVRNAKPALAGFSSVQVPEHVLCRRYIMKEGYQALNPVTGHAEQVVTNPFGAAYKIDRSAGSTDPEVGYIALKDMDGNWISILANYSLHYVGDWESGTISSDYFGEFAKQLQTRLPVNENFVAIMSNGTSGDINCWDFLHPERYPAEPFQKSKLIAGEIATKLVASLPQIAWEDRPSLAVQYDELTLNIRKPAPEELAAAKKLVHETDYQHLVINDDGLRRMYAREQVLLQECPDTARYPLQAFRIGSGIIGSVSGEVFAETGLWIKANSPTKKYFTIGLANGNSGYVPPAHEIERGGYETWRCRYSNLEPQAESRIRQRFLQMLQQFK
jgi:neutral ceramidase